MKVIKGNPIEFDMIKRGLPLFRMTLLSFYYDLKIRILWGVALLPVVASVLIRLLEEVPRSITYLIRESFSPIALTVFLNLIVVWFSLVIGSSLIADEKENQTFAFLLMRPISREEIIFHKFLAYITAMAIFSLVPVFGTYIVLFSYNSSWLVYNLDLAFGFWALIILGHIAFGAIFLLTGVLFRRPLIIGLFIALFWNYLPILLGEVAEQFTLTYHLENLFNKVFGLFPSTGTLVSFAFIGGLTLISVLGSMISFKGQEIL
ncbi:MAG: ABC transporter permease [Candidatus Heimdallarchaeota archaeon]